MGIKNVLAIIGTLCLFSSAMAFASNSISLMVAKQWIWKTPSIFIFTIGYLFNIKSKKDANSLFEGGSYEDIEKRQDAHSPARGAVWLFIGTVLLIITLFL